MAERVHSLVSLLVHGLRAPVDDGARMDDGARVDDGALPLSGWLVVVNGIVEAAHLLADAPTAAAAYNLLLPYADLPAAREPGIGSVRHALGVAALTTGDVDRAVEHLHAAVRHNAALAHWPAVTASRHRLAQALARRGRPQDLAWAERERAASAPGLADKAFTCTREGRLWRVSLGQHSAVVEHRIGMLHLAVLTANPGQEIAAAELAAGSSALSSHMLSSQPVLDRTAIHEYRNRLAELREQIDHRAADGHSERVALARAERDWLEAELAGATGLAGRSRHFSDNHERARIAVGKAIRRAIEQIATADAAIGDYVSRTVRTGTRCVYLPV